jgi:hypothetical protein
LNWDAHRIGWAVAGACACAVRYELWRVFAEQYF